MKCRCYLKLKPPLLNGKARQEEQAAEAGVAQETSNFEDDEEEQVPQADEKTQWVTATTRYGRSSRLPSRFARVECCCDHRYSFQELLCTAL